ncbi:IclR family transcriptional regulator [Paenibacillus sediminis]|uniref:DNA-binding IclR family transcriptional regulator n=1 Tax=Paenibacillus sediminis TaxID=664909 RepID=A0ABS4GY95_9BACL|nr:IclR family transcriptional regulator [Paenibacillus sediminis]MBP1935240.1 DNA-binding IclR family transcriptional regulator [Paenibacillus sediminis]
MTKENNEKRLLSSLQNALHILLSYSLDTPLQGITDISNALGLGKSTVHRLVTTLANEGFLVKDKETQKYRLGYSVLALSGVVTSNLDIYNESLPIVRNLVNKVDETAHIGVLDEGHVIYLLKVECNHLVRFLTHVGRRNPLHCTSSGKVILAHQETEFINNYIGSDLNGYTKNTITNPKTLLNTLTEIREQGYSTSYEELLEGVHSVAAPIRDYTGKVVAAITIVGPKQRMLQSKAPFFAKHVIEAANEISMQLGYIKRKSKI